MDPSHPAESAPLTSGNRGLRDVKRGDFRFRLGGLAQLLGPPVLAVVPRVDQEVGDYTVFKSRLIFPSGGHYGEMSVHLQSEKVLFIEFSAGITYGTNTYPLPSGSGYGMGTYNPSSSNWSNPKGWYYKDESSPQANEKGLVHTYGNPAYMPMYRAREAMALKVWQIARDTIGA